MLPDCFASRLSGALVDVEKSVLMVETAAGMDENPEKNLCDLCLCDFDLAAHAEAAGVEEKLFDSAADLRWLNRRIRYVHEALTLMIIMFPDWFGGCFPSLCSFGSIWPGGHVLARLRGFSGEKAHLIPLPVGLKPGDIVSNPLKYMILQSPALDPP
jgi:hypothetical protein